MNYPIFYNDSYVVPGGGLETVRKADEVAKRILEQFPDIKLVSPEPATVEQLLLAHTAEYIKAFLSGEPYDLASAALGEWSEEVVASVLASTGGVIAAALEALRSGKAGSLSSGLHHAKSDHGAGFCTINGLAIAALIALANGANSVGILDVDAHCGGGTFDIVGDNPAIRIGDVSTSSFDSWRSGQERHKLEITTDPDAYLDVVAEMLDRRHLAAPSQLGELLLDQFLDRIAEVHEVRLDRLAEPAVGRGESHGQDVARRREFVPGGFGAVLGVAAQAIGQRHDLAEDAAGVRVGKYGGKDRIHGGHLITAARRGRHRSGALVGGVKTPRADTAFGVSVRRRSIMKSQGNRRMQKLRLREPYDADRRLRVHRGFMEDAWRSRENPVSREQRRVRRDRGRSAV